MSCQKGIIQHKWTKEEIEFLKTNYLLYDINKLVPLFNEHFNYNMSKKTIRATLSRFKIHCNRPGAWQKGRETFNKGMKWDDYMSKKGQENSRKTCFSSKDRNINNSNHNELPIGTEIVDKDGYVFVKIDKPKGTKARKWFVRKNRLIYEQAHGEIPKGYCVIFADGNKNNFDINNLVLVKNNEMTTMTKHKLRYKDFCEATKVGLNMAKLIIVKKQLLKRKKEK